MSQASHNRIQKLYRAKFLQAEAALEREMAKIIDQLDGKIQRVTRRYVTADGIIPQNALVKMNEEIDALAAWYREQITEQVDKGLIDSAKIAISGQDAATRGHIKDMIGQYQGESRALLVKAASDPMAPFYLATRYGDGLPARVRDVVWNQRWSDGFTLSDRIWNHGSQVGDNLQSMVEQCVNQGRSAVEFSRAVGQYLNEPGPKWTTAIKPAKTDRGSVKYNALRLARTETNQAYHRAQRISDKKSSLVKGTRWNLSASHPLDWPASAAYQGYPEICDYYAEHDHAGLGPGVFPPGETPFDHPNGFCYLTSVVLEGDELIDELEKEYDVKVPKTQREKDKVGFKEAKTIKEAEEWAKKNLNVESVNYKQMDLEMANELNKQLDELTKKYNINDKFTIKPLSKKESNMALFKVKGGIDERAGTLNNFRIEYSVKRSGNIADMKRAALQLHDGGIIKNATVQELLTHEIGHMVDLSKTERVIAGASPATRLKDATRRHIIDNYGDQPLDARVFYNELEDRFGKYINANPQEQFAEMFRLYEHGKLPDDLGFVKDIMEGIE